jgi:glycosyltransferase involved in cell wall biosynthesis
VLFLSRIHPVKGLPMLIDAWSQVDPDGWRLVIAGPDEEGHRAEVESKVRERALADVVDFVGPVSNDEKWTLYRNSDLFVLPTYSENFGIVVAEALASGCPVLTTTGAPWQMLEEHGCGWWVEPTAEQVASALREAVERSNHDRSAMGKRGRELVKRRFSWSSIAERLVQTYRWVTSGKRGATPDWVQFQK